MSENQEKRKKFLQLNPTEITR